MKRILLSIIVVTLFSHLISAQAIKVELVKTEEGYSLYRDGKPYYIKGVGGKGHIDELLYLNGNSIRTWGVDEADEALRLAEENGLTVMLGLWVQHERHGFDYNDEAAVQKQLENFTKVVKKYKDHPALLLWGIGNEVDLFYSNTKVWDAIQDIAAMIHELDPNHPTSTVTAGLEKSEVELINEKAPDIDIYGINTYGDIAKVSQNLEKFGWSGAYIISEWGPNGHWEVQKTEWGAPIEQTSTEKASTYSKRYSDYIAAQRKKCIGSYAFLWGQKQETTSTWYGLFTENGNPTEPLDELYRVWQGKEPQYTAIPINKITLDKKTANESIQLKAGDAYKANIHISENKDQKLNVEWLVFPESANTKSGGDFEKGIQPILGQLRSRKDTSVTLIAPDKEGAYRLFVFITTNGKRTSYANIPFYVSPRKSTDPQSKGVQLKKRKLEVNK